MVLKEKVVDREKIMAVDKDKNLLKSSIGGSNSCDNKVGGFSAAEGCGKSIKNKQSSGGVIMESMDGYPGTDMTLPEINSCKNRSTLAGELIFRTREPLNGRTSSGPKSISSSVYMQSSIISSTCGRLDELKNVQCLERPLLLDSPKKLKRSLSLWSPSSGITQSCDKRQQKSSRLSKVEVASLVSGYDQSQSLCKGHSSSGSGAELGKSDPSEVLPCKSTPCNAKLRPLDGNSPSAATLLECENPGVAENKNRDKVINYRKDTNSSAKRNGRSEKGSCDDVRKNVRCTRGSTQLKTCLSIKEAETIVPKSSGKCRTGSNRSKSKSHSYPKRAINRRASIQSLKAMSMCTSQLEGNCADHEDLVAAAAHVHCLSSVHTSCLKNDVNSNTFWEKMRPFFAFVSSDKTMLLQKLLTFAMDLDDCFKGGMQKKVESIHHGLSIELSSGQEKVHSNVAIPVNSFGMKSFNQDQSVLLSGELKTNGHIEVAIPLSQRLLAAIIEEKETDSGGFINKGYSGDNIDLSNVFVAKNCSNLLELECDKYSPLQLRDCSRTSVSLFGGSLAHSSVLDSVSNGHTYRTSLQPENCTPCSSFLNVPWQCHSFIKSRVDTMQSRKGHLSDCPPSDCFYKDMSLDDKILLELQSIGIFLENVSDDGDNEIDKEISNLTSRLHEQIRKSKDLLYTVDKALKDLSFHEERKLELLAMSKLVEMAYGKLMGNIGGRGSTYRSGGNRFSKKGALAFAKRVLAKWEKFEDSGRSCFSEPPYRDILFSSVSFSETIDSQIGNALTKTLGAGFSCSTNIVDKDDSAIPVKAFAYSTCASSPCSEVISNRGMKNQLLLGGVIGANPSRTSPIVGNAIAVSAKGRGCERNLDGHTDSSLRCVTKTGSQLLVSSKRKRTKTRVTLIEDPVAIHQSETQAALPVVPLSEAGTSEQEGIGPVYPVISSSRLSNERESPVFSSQLLCLNDEFGSQASDMSAWLDIDEECLQDTEFIGLEIPMDDISELDMNISDGFFCSPP